MPTHLQPYYRKEEKVVLPVAEKLWPQLLTLPWYAGLTDAEVKCVCEAVLSFCPGSTTSC